MKLSQLSDQNLLQQTLNLVRKEKELLSEILSHLQEVQRRRLFCELGCGSLFQYCVKHLGYSEDQAYRRINALKLIKQMPEVHAQIAKGELTLSSLAVAQSLFKADEKVNKKEVLAAIKNKSKREAEKVMKTFSPKAPDYKREIHLSLSHAQGEKWEAVKAKLAHCNLSEGEILERLCDLFLPPTPAPRAPRPAPPRSFATSPRPKASLSRPNRRELFQKAQQKCTNCNSTYALEIDHRIPKSLGGSNHSSNLRVLCRSCNQRAAIQLLGIGKMQKYLEKKP